MIVNKKDKHPTTSTTSTLDSINSSLTDKSPQQIVRPLAITTLIKDEKSENLKENNFLCSGMIEQQRNKDIRVEEVSRKQLYNSCIRPNDLFIPNYSPLPTRPKSELSRRPSISLTDSTILQGEAGCGSNNGRFTIKYDNTEYVVDERSSDTDNSIAVCEEDTYNKYYNFDCNDEKPNEKEQQQQKRFGEMALETVKR
uniref:Uncharacterized protein n=1 Tax=Meloidogyne javanica TaxID=6303 RepID=A0A915LJW4_MELJA